MKTLNFRHSLKTMNSELIDHNEKINHFMENGCNVYHVVELTLGRWVTCGFYYSASDIADYINKRNA
jgi:hypothetical protein